MSLCDKAPYIQSYGFSSSPVWIWELDHKEVWVLKNWCFKTVVFEKTLKSPLGCKEIKPVCPKGNQPWIFIGRTVAEAEAPILWPPDANSWLTEKDPDGWERLKAKGEGGGRGWDEIASLTPWTWVWANPGDNGGQKAWHATVYGITQSRTRLNDWTTKSRSESYQAAHRARFNRPLGPNPKLPGLGDFTNFVLQRLYKLLHCPGFDESLSNEGSLWDLMIMATGQNSLGSPF